MIRVVAKKAPQWNSVFLLTDSVQNAVTCTQCDCGYRSRSVNSPKSELEKKHGSSRLKSVAGLLPCGETAAYRYRYRYT